MTKNEAGTVPDLAATQAVLEYWLGRLPRMPQPFVGGSRSGSRTSRSVVRLPLREGRQATWILWPPGSAVPLHGHAGASRVGILHGTLTEIVRDSAGEIRARRNWTREHEIVIAAGEQHEVRNLSNTTAATVHVYEPAGATLTFHLPHTQGGHAAGRAKSR